MGFLDKVRTLVGALVHKPFSPRPDKVDLDKESNPPESVAVHPARSELEEQEAGVTETERVADLIAQQKREGQS
jgi:hypothetical protein